MSSWCVQLLKIQTVRAIHVIPYMLYILEKEEERGVEI
jgi:hypothetical protein